MSFWPFCCKFPQVHRIADMEGRQFPRVGEESGGQWRPQLDGMPRSPYRGVDRDNFSSIDNEGDWLCLSDYAGIKSDGTLWCWIRDVVRLKAFQRGLDVLYSQWEEIPGAESGGFDDESGGVVFYPIDMPVQISDDTNWSYVTSQAYSGFAIKSDGSLWAFGYNADGNLGIGLTKSGTSGFFSDRNKYRARLSCAIERVEVYSTGFNKKPTPELRFYNARNYQQRDTAPPIPEELGAGATFEVDWTGSVYDDDVTVTSGGTGYKSPPFVSLVASSEDDEGKTVSGTVTSMLPVSVYAFSVLNGGSGYTQATATESFTGATAQAQIEGGVIVGWTFQSAGTKTVSLTAPYSLSVNVSGDGTGGSATALLQTSTVLAVSFPESKIWTSTPLVEFSGGGGEGASATVEKIYGAVDAIRVTNGGSGYTQQKDNAYDGTSRGRLAVVLIRDPLDSEYETRPEEKWSTNVYLSPGRASEFVLNFDEPPPVLEKASTGKVAPFEMSNPDSTHVVESAEMISPYVPTVLLQQTVNEYGQISFANTTDRSGYTYPPFFLIKYREHPSPPYSLDDSWDYSYTVQDPCGPPSMNRVLYRSPRPPLSGAWPAAEEEITVTGVLGEEATYKNIDGVLKLDSRTWAEVPAGFNNPTVLTYSSQPTMYTGVTRTVLMNIHEAVLYVFQSSTGSLWTPPTIEERLRIYAEPPSKGGEAAYGEVGPDSDGYGSSPAMVTQGGLYTSEPECISVSCFFEFPVRVGQDTWKSVSQNITNGPGGIDAVTGVTTSGELYWWGMNAANGTLTPCPFPSPFGQGVAIDVLPIAGELKAPGLIGGSRAYISPPEHGVHHASVPPLESFNAGLGSGPQVASPDSGPFGSHPQQIRNLSLPAKDRWFVPPPNLLQPLGRAGCGYTSTPTVTLISIGEPVVELSPRLIGPTSFTSVRSGYARGDDGTWHIPYPNQQIIRRVPLYSYTVTSSRCFQPSSTSQFDADEDTATRTVSGYQCPVNAYISRGGSGYTSATASVSYTSRVASSEVVSPSYETVDCSGTTVYISSTAVSSYFFSHQPQTRQKAIGVASVSGRVVPAFIGSGLPLFGGEAYGAWKIFTSTSASASLTGSGGSNAVLSCSVQETDFESHVTTASSPGMPDQLSLASLGEIFQGTSFDSPAGGTTFFPYEGEPFPYTADQFPGWLTQASESGATRRKGADGSLWFVTGSYNRDSLGNAVTISSSAERMFSIPLSISSTGERYGDVATATVTQQPGVATAEPVFNGKVSAIGVMSQGSGYSSPPEVTLATDGTGDAGTATAVIAGPVDMITVTNPGSGYRVPPEVRFSGKGISPSATCTLDENGGVSSVHLSSGGRYRDTPPSVSFVPVVQIESLSIDDGGDGYTLAPDVFIGGGGGIGAAATCRIRAEVIEITLTSQGSGYTSVPTVVIEGGDGSGATAIAGISFENNVVTGITLQNHGDFYQSTPTVRIVGGGGSGAAAIARISGYVDQITLVARGEDFVIPPEIVFFNGGGGTGASATATLASPGGGAAATARLNGSIIYCKQNNDSSGLQTEPSVYVSESTNYMLSDLYWQTMDGVITTAEYETLAKKHAALLKSRISGNITGLQITNAGSGYRQGTVLQAETIDDPRIIAASFVSPTYSTEINFPSNTYVQTQGISVPVTVSSSGQVASLSMAVTPTKSLQDETFWKKPKITFADGLAAMPYTCLTLCGSAIEKAPVQSGMNTRWDGTVHNGIKSVAVNRARGKTAGLGVLSVTGGIESYAYVGATYPYPYSLYDSASSSYMYYDPVPTVTVEDESGVGAAMSMGKVPTLGALTYFDGSSSAVGTGGFKLTSPGSGYTVSARPVIKGGTPTCWSNKAAATASISLGAVSSVSVTAQGKGYNAVPSVIIYGGGGVGATARAVLTTGKVTSIVVTGGGSGYTSSPSVVIIDRDRPFEKTAKGRSVQAAIDAYGTAVIKDYTPEFCLQTARWQYTLMSPVGLIPSQHGASFVPFFDDDGYVEAIHWNVGSKFGYRELAFAPTVTSTPGESTSPATYSTSIATWSTVFSAECAKTA